MAFPDHLPYLRPSELQRFADAALDAYRVGGSIEGKTPDELEQQVISGENYQRFDALYKRLFPREGRKAYTETVRENLAKVDYEGEEYTEFRDLMKGGLRKLVPSAENPTAGAHKNYRRAQSKFLKAANNPAFIRRYKRERESPGSTLPLNAARSRSLTKGGPGAVVENLASFGTGNFEGTGRPRYSDVQAGQQQAEQKMRAAQMAGQDPRGLGQAPISPNEVPLNIGEQAASGLVSGADALAHAVNFPLAGASAAFTGPHMMSMRGFMPTMEIPTTDTYRPPEGMSYEEAAKNNMRQFGFGPMGSTMLPTNPLAWGAHVKQDIAPRGGMGTAAFESGMEFGAPLKVYQKTGQLADIGGRAAFRGMEKVFPKAGQYLRAQAGKLGPGAREYAAGGLERTGALGRTEAGWWSHLAKKGTGYREMEGAIAQKELLKSAGHGMAGFGGLRVLGGYGEGGLAGAGEEIMNLGIQNPYVEATYNEQGDQVFPPDTIPVGRTGWGLRSPLTGGGWAGEGSFTAGYKAITGRVGRGKAIRKSHTKVRQVERIRQKLDRNMEGVEEGEIKSIRDSLADMQQKAGTEEYVHEGVQGAEQLAERISEVSQAERKMTAADIKFLVSAPVEYGALVEATQQNPPIQLRSGERTGFMWGERKHFPLKEALAAIPQKGSNMPAIPKAAMELVEKIIGSDSKYAKETDRMQFTRKLADASEKVLGELGIDVKNREVREKWLEARKIGTLQGQDRITGEQVWIYQNFLTHDTRAFFAKLRGMVPMTEKYRKGLPAPEADLLRELAEMEGPTGDLARTHLATIALTQGMADVEGAAKSGSPTDQFVALQKSMTKAGLRHRTIAAKFVNPFVDFDGAMDYYRSWVQPYLKGEKFSEGGKNDPGPEKRDNQLAMAAKYLEMIEAADIARKGPPPGEPPTEGETVEPTAKPPGEPPGEGTPPTGTPPAAPTTPAAPTEAPPTAEGKPTRTAEEYSRSTDPKGVTDEYWEKLRKEIDSFKSDKDMSEVEIRGMREVLAGKSTEEAMEIADKMVAPARIRRDVRESRETEATEEAPAEEQVSDFERVVDVAELEQFSQGERRTSPELAAEDREYVDLASKLFLSDKEATQLEALNDARLKRYRENLSQRASGEAKDLPPERQDEILAQQDIADPNTTTKAEAAKEIGERLKTGTPENIAFVRGVRSNLGKLYKMLMPGTPRTAGAKHEGRRVEPGETLDIKAEDAKGPIGKVTPRPERVVTEGEIGGLDRTDKKPISPTSILANRTINLDTFVGSRTGKGERVKPDLEEFPVEQERRTGRPGVAYEEVGSPQRTVPAQQQAESRKRDQAVLRQAAGRALRTVRTTAQDAGVSAPTGDLAPRIETRTYPPTSPKAGQTADVEFPIYGVGKGLTRPLLKAGAEQVSATDLPKISEELRKLGRNDLADRVDQAYMEATEEAMFLSQEIGASVAGLSAYSMEELRGDLPGGFFNAGSTKLLAEQVRERIDGIDEAIAEIRFASKESESSVPYHTTLGVGAQPTGPERVHYERLVLELPGAEIRYTDAEGEVQTHKMSAEWNGATDPQAIDFPKGLVRDRGVEIPLDNILTDGIRHTRLGLGLNDGQIITVLEHIWRGDMKSLRADLIKMETPQLAALASYLWPAEGEGAPVFAGWSVKLRGKKGAAFFPGGRNAQGKLKGPSKNALGTVYEIINARHAGTTRFGPAHDKAGTIEESTKQPSFEMAVAIKEPKVQQRTATQGDLPVFLLKQFRVLTKAFSNPERRMGTNPKSRKIAQSVYDAIAKLSDADLDLLRPQQGVEASGPVKAPPGASLADLMKLAKKSRADQSRRATTGASPAIERWADMARRTKGLLDVGEGGEVEKPAARALTSMPEIIAHVIEWRDTGKWKDVPSDVSPFRGVEVQPFDKSTGGREIGEDAMGRRIKGAPGSDVEEGVYVDQAEPAPSGSVIETRQRGEGGQAGFKRALAVLDLATEMADADVNKLVPRGGKDGKQIIDHDYMALASLFRDNPRPDLWDKTVKDKAGALVKRLDIKLGRGSTNNALTQHTGRDYVQHIPNLLKGHRFKEGKTVESRVEETPQEAGEISTEPATETTTLPPEKRVYDPGLKRYMNPKEYEQYRNILAGQAEQRKATPYLLEKLSQKYEKATADTSDVTDLATDPTLTATIRVRNTLQILKSVLRDMHGFQSRKQTRYRVRNAEGKTTGQSRRSLKALRQFHTARIKREGNAGVRENMRKAYQVDLLIWHADLQRMLDLQTNTFREGYELIKERVPDVIAEKVTLRTPDAVQNIEAPTAVDRPPVPDTPKPAVTPPSGTWAVPPANIRLGNFSTAKDGTKISGKDMTEAILITADGKQGVVNLDEHLPKLRESILQGTPMNVKALMIDVEYLNTGKHKEVLDRITDWDEVLRAAQEAIPDTEGE